MKKFTFVTGWFRRHGIAFLDMVLLALDGASLRSAGLKAGSVLAEGEDQYQLAKAVGYSGHLEDGVSLSSLSRVVYLAPKNHKGLSEIRPLELVAADRWKGVLESVAINQTARTGGDSESDIWKDDFEALRKEIIHRKAFPDLGWFESTWGGESCEDRLRLLWHVVNEAPLQFQREWYERYSPLYARNRELIEFVDVDVDNAESPDQVATEMHRWLRNNNYPDQNLLVNLRGTSTAVQFGWYYLAWRMPVLKNAAFIECRTDRGSRTERFVPIKVAVVPKDPIAKLGHQLAPRSWESEWRKRARAQLRFYLGQDDNFSVLLLGKRGTGKSRSVREAWNAKQGKAAGFHEANCANFSDHQHARSELFGHKKGAFTGAVKDRKGLFEDANGGLLFLDEVHHLDKITRAMLLTALQTDGDGWYSFTPLGGSRREKSKFQLVVASNRDVSELREKLEPDFLDRISQRCLEFPPVSNDEREGAWNLVWEEMQFKGNNLANPVAGDQFRGWLQSIPLDGNFRDLQRIAILVADYQRGCAAQEDGAELGLADDLMHWLRDNMTRWDRRSSLAGPDDEHGSDAGSQQEATVAVPFDLDSPSAEEKGFIRACRRQFAEDLKLRFGKQKDAVAELNRRGSRMTEATFSKWIRGL